MRKFKAVYTEPKNTTLLIREVSNLPHYQSNTGIWVDGSYIRGIVNKGDIIEGELDGNPLFINEVIGGYPVFIPKEVYRSITQEFALGTNRLFEYGKYRVPKTHFDRDRTVAAIEVSIRQTRMTTTSLMRGESFPPDESAVYYPDILASLTYDLWGDTFPKEIWIDPNLLSALSRTDVREDELAIPKQLGVYYGIFHLPKNNPLVVSRDGNIAVEAISINISKAPSNPDGDTQLGVYAIYRGIVGTAVGEVISINEFTVREFIEVPKEGSFSGNTPPEPHQRLTKEVVKLAINILRVMAWEPELVGQPDRPNRNRQNTPPKSKRNSTPAWLNKLAPTWLGRGYKPAQDVGITNNIESTGKRVHWRCGHWHNYWVGSGGDRHKELRWIEPILVNKDKVEPEGLPKVLAS